MLLIIHILDCISAHQVHSPLLKMNCTKKALKVYYKLHKDLLTLNPNINTSLHVFDHTINPILLYGCEIRGSFNPTTARFRNEIITMDKIYQNLKCELLHTKFCKFILGVHIQIYKYWCPVRVGKISHLQFVL